MHPPDPKMRRGGPPQATPEFTSSQNRKYRISVETQAAFWFLAPTFLIVALLAIGGRL
jgi:hypothetical protein